MIVQASFDDMQIDHFLVFLLGFVNKVWLHGILLLVKDNLLRGQEITKDTFVCLTGSQRGSTVLLYLYG